jgi:hypothetical protein
MGYLNREFFEDSIVLFWRETRNQFFSKPFKKSFLIFLAYLQCGCVQNQKIAPEQETS